MSDIRPLILVVNDDLDTLELTALQISSTGEFDVVTAPEGETAIQLIRQQRPDVIVSDISMPMIDGFQLCRILKSPLFPGSELIPVILSSATYRDVIAEQVARNVQAFAYLQQPHDESTLFRLIDLALERCHPRFDDRALLQHIGKIVIVDDDPDLIRLLEAVLEAEHWDVKSAQSAEAGKVLLTELDAQLVLLDYHLPDGNGLDMLTWIKQHCPQAVVIVMTADSNEEVVISLIKNGADDYMRKPFDLNAISIACRNAHNKYNFLRIHEQFQEKIERLRAVSDYLDLVVNHSQEAIFSCDGDGRVKIWNKGAEKIYGYAASDVSGAIVDDFLDPPGHERKASDVMVMLTEKGSFAETEVRRKKKNGEIITVSATYSAIQNPTGEFIGFSVIERDVTTVKELEMEKIKTARLKAITQTAVTANDHINTPLGVILGYSQFLQKKLDNLGADDMAALDTIQQQVLKIKNIMNKLKLMSDPIVKNYSIEGVTMLDLSQSK